MPIDVWQHHGENGGMIRVLLTVIVCLLLACSGTLSAVFAFAEGMKLLRRSETHEFRSIRENPPGRNVSIELPEHTAHFEKAHAYRVVHHSDDGDVIRDSTVYPISDVKGATLLLRTERFGYVKDHPVGVQKGVFARMADEAEREEVLRELRIEKDTVPVLIERMQGYWSILLLECGVSVASLISVAWALFRLRRSSSWDKDKQDVRNGA